MKKVSLSGEEKSIEDVWSWYEDQKTATPLQPDRASQPKPDRPAIENLNLCQTHPLNNLCSLFS
ncbi:MAG: hypothetical protein WD491_04200 [Balneolales bacterium]